MKRLIVLIVFISVAVSARAQFGVEAGWVNSVLREKDDWATLRYKALNGFYIGLNYSIPVYRGLSVQPSLSYSYTRYGESENLLDYKVKESLTDQFFNIPVDIKYTFDVAGDLKAFAFAGPRFVVGLSAVEKETVTGGGSSETEKYNFYKEDDMSRFDFQLGVGAGIRYGSCSFKLGYDWGMIDRWKDGWDDEKLKRGQFYLGLGYTF